MSPQEAISGLDGALAEIGEDVILRRVVGILPNTQNIDVTCRASVTSWRMREQPLVGNLAQFDFIFVISKTQIDAAQWPGGAPQPLAGLPSTDPSIPRKGDKVRRLKEGVWRNIEVVDPREVAGEIVRIEMMTLG